MSTGTLPASWTPGPTTSWSRQRLGRFGWSAVAIAALGVLIPLALLPAAAPAGGIVVTQLLVTSYLGLRLGAYAGSARYHLVAACAATYAYIWLGLAALAQLVAHHYPLSNSFSSSVSLRSTIAVGVGAVAFDVAYLAVGARRRLTFVEVRRLSWSRLWLLSAAALAACLLIVPRVGGFDAFLSSRNDLAIAAASSFSNHEDKSLQAIATSFVNVLPFVAFLGLVLLIRARSARAPVSAAVLPLFLVLLALNVLVNNPLSQPRFWAGTVILSLLFSTRWLAGQRSTRAAVPLLVVLLLVVFPYADYFRDDASSRNALQVHSVPHQLTSKLDYDSYEQLQVGVRYVDTEGPTLGRSLLGPALFWLPRRVWADKPRDTGVVLAEAARYPVSNLSAPLWVEGYVAGGYAGVAVLLGLAGLIARRLDNTAGAFMEEPAALASALVPAVAFYSIFLLRGSLLQATGRVVVLVGALWLMSTREQRP